MEMRDSACQFMYQNGDEYVLMDNKTFEEYNVPAKLVDPNLAKVLESGTQVKYRQSDGRPIMISAGPTIKCTIADVIDARESSDMKKKYNTNSFRKQL
jgi:translation elongation factor P/translation initiation factor 5A